MIWLLAGVALAATVGIGALAWWLMRRNGAHRFGSAEEAVTAAEQAIAGFRGVSAVLGSDGQAALVFGDGLRVAVVKAHASRAAAREIVWRDVRATHEGLLVATGDWRLGNVLVAGVDNLDVRRLAPQLIRAA